MSIFVDAWHVVGFIVYWGGVALLTLTLLAAFALAVVFILMIISHVLVESMDGRKSRRQVKAARALMDDPQALDAHLRSLDSQP